MPGKKGLNGAHTRALHARRMGDAPLPSLREALKSDPVLRAKLKEQVSEAAKKADKRERLIEQRRDREQRRMTAPGLFLCGCNPLDKKVQQFRYELIWVNGNQVLTNKFFNKAGEQICPIHGQPLYGFRTDQELRARHQKVIQTPGRPDIEDQRDLRDPSEVGEEYLASKSGLGNGGPPNGT